jgi:threonine dehydratase
VTAEILAIVSAVMGGGLVAGLIQIYKARPERDSVIVSATQNAAEILQGVNTALYTELNHEREKSARLNRQLAEASSKLREHGVEWDRESIS